MKEETKLLLWFATSGVGIITFITKLDFFVWGVMTLCLLIYTLVTYRIGFTIGYNTRK